MKKHLPLIIVLALLAFSAAGQTPVQAFLKKHAASFKAIDCAEGFAECYEVYLRQPVDPKDPPYRHPRFARQPVRPAGKGR